jgi:hypothetical protein
MAVSRGLRVKRLPLVVAAGSLSGGFITMSLVSLAWTPPSGLPSMWDYWSGTVGDLLLPVVLYGLTCGCLLLAAGENEKPSRWSVVVGLLGAGLGACSQVAWLADSSPRRNWMLVEPHRFSTVGWYHAVFLVVTSGYVAGSAVELLLRARRLARAAKGRQAASRRRLLRSVLSGNGSALVACAASVFVVTVVADSLPSGATSSSHATIIAILAAPLLTLLLAALMLGREVRLLVLPVLVAFGAVGAALALASSAAGAPKISIAAVAALLTGIGLAATLYQRGPIFRTEDARLTVPPIACLLLVSIAGRPSPLAGTLLFGVLGINLVALVALGFMAGIARRQHRPARRSSLSAILTASFICLIAALGTVLSFGDRLGQVQLLGISVLFSVALGALAVQQILEGWQPMIRAERTRDSSAPGTPSRRLQATTTRAWIIATTTGFGAFLSLVLIAFETMGNTLELGTAAPTPQELPVAAAAIVIGFVLGSPAAITMVHDDRFSRDAPPEKPPTDRRLLAAAAVALVALASATTWLATTAGWHGLISLAVACAVFLVAIDCLQTVVVDSTLMCLRWPDTVDCLAGIMAAIVQGTALYWAMLSAAGSNGMQLGYAFLLFAVAAIVRMIASATAQGHAMFVDA